MREARLCAERLKDREEPSVQLTRFSTMKAVMKNPVLENLIFVNCLVCRKPIKEGYYGRWEGGGTCSKKCEEIQETKPKCPPSTLGELK